MGVSKKSQATPGNILCAPTKNAKNEMSTNVRTPWYGFLFDTL
jgi:hypothetical protein